MEHRYSDIRHLPRPVSHRHAHMSMVDRGAQFSPFAALTGYEAVIQETARRTEAETELTEDEVALLDGKLRYLAAHPEERGVFVCFRPDGKKSGGAFVRYTGPVERIDLQQQTVTLKTGTVFPMSAIRSLESEGQI